MKHTGRMSSGNLPHSLFANARIMAKRDSRSQAARITLRPRKKGVPNNINSFRRVPIRLASGPQARGFHPVAFERLDRGARVAEVSIRQSRDVQCLVVFQGMSVIGSSIVIHKQGLVARHLPSFEIPAKNIRIACGWVLSAGESI